jgi:hypothetical protein
MLKLGGGNSPARAVLLPNPQKILSPFKLSQAVPIGVIELRYGSVSWKEEPPAPGKALLWPLGSAAPDGNLQ